METTKNILLLANDLSSDEAALIGQSLEQAKEQGLEFNINLVYIKPSMPTCYFHMPSTMSLEKQQASEANQVLADLGEQLNVKPESRWLASGHVKAETLRLAKELKSEYILTGTNRASEVTQPFMLKKRFKINTASNISQVCQRSAG